jgi:predicted HNH restriction endonuclease
LNNNEDNLQVLCPNCHSLTSTYKNLNKLGRKQRKKYSN